VGTEVIPECAVTRFYDPCLTGIEDKAVASLGQINGRVFGRNGKQIGTRFCYEIMTGDGAPGKTDTYATCAVPYNERDISGGIPRRKPENFLNERRARQSADPDAAQKI
jgi:hypothetical protein